jgi:hypothetical protein
MYKYEALKFFFCNVILFDRLCGLVVRVPGYRSRDRGSIHGATRFSGTGLKEKVAAHVYKTEITAVRDPPL